MKQFLINLHGEIDGMMLNQDVDVHFPHHMPWKVGALAAIGDKANMRGVRLRLADMIAGISLETADGKRLRDPGPPSHDERHKSKAHAAEYKASIDAQGIIQRPLHGPTGQVRGVLLVDGTAVRFPKHAAAALTRLTKAGASFAVRGYAVNSKCGGFIAAQKIGSSQKTLLRIRS